MDIRKVTDDFSVAPQIALDDLEQIAALGFKSVISNRPDDEHPGQPSSSEIEATATATGLAFRHVPVVSGMMTAEDVTANSSAIAELEGPTLAFCLSGTRSIMLWAQGQLLSGNMDADTVIALGANAGYNLSAFRR